MSAKQKQEAWDCDSVDAALVFLCFHKRIFHPDSFSGAGIYDHPELNPFFAKYSRKGFGRYCQTQANREIKYRKKGVWPNRKFKNSVAKASNETYKDLLDSLQPWKDLEGEDLEDEAEDFVPADDDDDEDFEADEPVNVGFDVLKIIAITSHELYNFM